MMWFRRTKRPKPTVTSPAETPAQSQVMTLDRFHVENSHYLLPKDAEEDNRLNFQHFALAQAIGNHYVAPLMPPLYAILDVGTGTGIWVGEMAKLFPSTLVIGVDISTRSFKNPSQANCLLRTGDVLAGLPFPDGLFDFTHQRLLTAGVPTAKWPQVIAELVRVTRPGGWVELVEIDNQMLNAGPATTAMNELVMAPMRELGFGGSPAQTFGDLLAQQGLTNIELQRIPIPVGEWAGRVGSFMKSDLLGVMNAMRARCCAHAGISESQFDRMMQAMAAEWETRQTSCLFYAAFGRRVTL